MRPVVISKTLAAASATNIALSQSPGAAGNLTINGAAATSGVATLDTARRVIITSGGNDTGITFTVYGTNAYGNAIQEKFAGANTGAASSNLDFLTVTRIAISAAAASTVTAGTNGVGSTNWVAVAAAIPTTELSTSVEVTGTINYTVEYTYQDLNNSPTSPYAYVRDNIVPTVWADSVVASKTANAVATATLPIWAARVTINSGNGTIKATFIQAGIAGP